VIFLSGSYIFTRVYNALAEREGKRVTLPTLATVTGLTETQIQNTIANARRTSQLHAAQIEVVRAGRVWRLRNNKREDTYATPEEIVEAVEVGSTHIWKRVLAALVENEGKISSKELLAERASTEEHPVTPHQAANAMMTILRRPNIGPQIETKVTGHAWKYHAPAETKKTVDAASAKPEGVVTVSTPIRGSVLRYFAQRPGETLFRDDIASDLGFTVKQVQSAVWGLLNDNQQTKDDFVVIQSSYAWQYVPNRKAVKANADVKPAENGHVTPALSSVPAQAYTPSAATTTLPVSSRVPSIPKATPAAAGGRLFEEIGQTSSGDILVQEAETKKIYRATEL
jgi:hypothetical protein